MANFALNSENFSCFSVTITGDEDAQMCYSPHTYWDKIVCRYGVAVKGWPTDVAFKSPSQVGSSSRVIARLRFGWKKGFIRFERLPKPEIEELKKTLESTSDVASDRKQRSDMDDTRQLRPSETRGKRRRARSGLHSKRYVDNCED